MYKGNFNFYVANVANAINAATLPNKDREIHQYLLVQEIYNFCYVYGYSYIMYVEPSQEPYQSQDSYTKNNKNTKNNTASKTNQPRRMRVLISLAGGVKKGLLEVRKFIPSEPGFIFAQYDAPDEIEKRTLTAFAADIVIDISGFPAQTKNQTKKNSQRKKQNKAKNILTGEWQYQRSKDNVKAMEKLTNFLAMTNEERQQLYTKLNFKSSVKNNISFPPYLTKKIKTNNHESFNTTKRDFCSQVSGLVDHLKKATKSVIHIPPAQQKENLKKVVLSKVKTIALPQTFNHIKYFFQLLKDYPNSLVNMIADPQLGTWVGASPEVLVVCTADKIFKTVSLAGTRWEKHRTTKNKNISLLNIPLHEVLWSQKEIQEQTVTSRFIIDCFKTLRLREYLEEGPMTVRKGNILHLLSEFSVDLKRYYGEALPYDMLGLLHPTPAVCGAPRSLAKKIIKKTELHERDYYAGYLGPIAIDGETNVFVNLRCMEFIEVNKKLSSRLYAGCGINQFSSPAQEWQETEAKMELLIKGLKLQTKL